MQIFSFKPYYNWNTFNTENKLKDITKGMRLVLNLVISGMPSIQRVYNYSLIYSTKF